MWCTYNQLTSLDVSNNTALTYLIIEYNQLTSLDVSNNTALNSLFCSGNQLTSLDVSYCTDLASLVIDEMPGLTEVCVWEMPFPPFGVYISTTGSPNVEFKDCSVGIDDYTISGLTIYPNPTGDLLTIETEYSDHYSINITTLNGQLILSTEMEGTAHKLDLSTCQKGVYFITVRSKDFVSTKKIIKL